MAKIKVSVTLYNGSAYQAIVKIGDKTLHFVDSETQTIELEPKVYIARIAGFQDPTNTDSTVDIKISQNGEELNSIEIKDRKFIKPLTIRVQ